MRVAEGVGGEGGAGWIGAGELVGETNSLKMDGVSSRHDKARLSYCKKVSPAAGGGGLRKPLRSSEHFLCRSGEWCRTILFGSSWWWWRWGGGIRFKGGFCGSKNHFQLGKGVPAYLPSVAHQRKSTMLGMKSNLFALDLVACERWHKHTSTSTHIYSRTGRDGQQSQPKSKVNWFLDKHLIAWVCDGDSSFLWNSSSPHSSILDLASRKWWLR